jgi:hypothetical protein
VAAPGFTEAEVVFDIGGGISVVRAARRTANPRKAAARGDFGASTLRALQRRGIRIIGTTAIPADAHDRYFSATGYELDDNGTHRIRTYLEVLALADGAPTTDREDNPRDDGQQSLPLFGRTGNPRQKSEVFEMERYTEPGSFISRGMIPREMVVEATTTTMDGHPVAYRSRDGDKRYTRDNSPCYYLLNSDGSPNRYAYAEKPTARRRQWVVVLPDDYGNSHAEYQTREQALTHLLKHSIPRTGNPHGGGLVSGYGINTFAMDPDDYAPERQSNPRESIATMLGRPRR